LTNKEVEEEKKMKGKDNSLMCDVNKRTNQQYRYEENTLPELISNQIKSIV
jgi:hypothetical protein